jgi:hypothetical protein
MTGWYILEVMRKYRVDGTIGPRCSSTLTPTPTTTTSQCNPVGSISGGTRRAMMRTIMLRA